MYAITSFPLNDQNSDDAAMFGYCASKKYPLILSYFDTLGTTGNLQAPT